MKKKNFLFLFMLMSALFTSVTVNAWKVYRDGAGVIHVSHGPCDWVHSSVWVDNPYFPGDIDRGRYFHSLSGPCGSYGWTDRVVPTPSGNPGDESDIVNHVFEGNYQGKPGVVIQLYLEEFNPTANTEPQVVNGVMYLGNCSWAITSNAYGATLQPGSNVCGGGSIGWTKDDPQAPAADINNYTFTGDFMLQPYLMKAVFNYVVNQPAAKGGLSDRNATISDLNKSKEWNVYPNPATNMLNLVGANNAVGSDYRITNIYGQSVSKNAISNKTEDINISDLPGGIYMLEIFSAGIEVQAIKFLKQ